ncbi:MAG: T6SS immunity protein Tdi1 domain-containing protein [Brooklawnia sp.]
MSTFSSFQSVAPVAEQTLATLQGNVPKNIIQLWRSHGAGYIGNGFLRLVDPAVMTPWLPSFLVDPQGCVPVFATALADVVVWRDNYYYVVNTRFGQAYPPNFARVKNFPRVIENTYFLDSDFRWKDYTPAAERLGVPGMVECLFYAHLLSLGGFERPESLYRGGLQAHLELAAGLQGKIEVGTIAPPNQQNG